MLRVLPAGEFDAVYALMAEAFPAPERRTRERARALLGRPEYTLYAAHTAEGTLSGFIASWRFPAFRFVEHFAVSPRLRGEGLGSALMREYLAMEEGPVRIEVEDGAEGVAARRIGFYRRLGFALSPFGYRQPAMQPTPVAGAALRIMSWPGEITEPEFALFCGTVFPQVYGLPPGPRV